MKKVQRSNILYITVKKCLIIVTEGNCDEEGATFQYPLYYGKGMLNNCH